MRGTSARKILVILHNDTYAHNCGLRLMLVGARNTFIGNMIFMVSMIGGVYLYKENQVRNRTVGLLKRLEEREELKRSDSE